MSVNCSDALGRRQRGFTAVEMITVLVLVGVLAVVAMPRMDAGLSLRGAAWRDQVQAGLMHARSQAQGHRRLVCLTLATGELRLAIASANPASACNTAVNGADGDARWAYDGNGFALLQSPAGTLYFQPDGRITSDGAGSSAVNVSIMLAGETALQLTGETGHVR
jgi:prepilin-type N-terminal cleavage/methylation domain-containing protein